MKIPFLLAVLSLLLPASGCGDQPDTTPQGSAGGGAPADTPVPADAQQHGHLHGDRIHLGAVELGDLRIEVFQVVELVPGKECDFDLDFAAGTTLPTIRGWLGDETGRGSRKALFEQETAERMHGHPEVPDPLAADAALWLDVEGAGKGSVMVRR